MTAAAWWLAFNLLAAGAIGGIMLHVVLLQQLMNPQFVPELPMLLQP
jgi:hypothetical protein